MAISGDFLYWIQCKFNTTITHISTSIKYSNRLILDNLGGALSFYCFITMKLAIKYVDFSPGNCRWRLQKPVTTHYLQSLNSTEHLKHIHGYYRLHVSMKLDGVFGGVGGSQ